jgi:hypothetical protein
MEGTFRKSGRITIMCGAVANGTAEMLIGL